MNIIKYFAIHYAIEKGPYFLYRLIDWGLSPKPRTPNFHFDHSRQLSIRSAYTPDCSESKMTYSVLKVTDILRCIMNNLITSQAIGFLSANTFFRSLGNLYFLPLTETQIQITQDPLNLTEQINSFRKEHNTNAGLAVKFETNKEFEDFIAFLQSPNGKSFLDKIYSLSLPFDIDSSSIDNISKILDLLNSNLRFLSLGNICQMDSTTELSIPNLYSFSCGNIDTLLNVVRPNNLHHFSCLKIKKDLNLKGYYDILPTLSFSCLDCLANLDFEVSIREITFRGTISDFRTIRFPEDTSNLKCINYQNKTFENPDILEKFKQDHSNVCNYNGSKFISDDDFF